MLKKILNETEICLDIEALDPMLVKAGGIALSGPDSQWLETRNKDGKLVQVVPGTSLKGLLRSYGEKILRTLNLPVCDPFDRNTSCGDLLEAKDPSSSKAYSLSCPICRIFGSKEFIGRIHVSDALPSQRLPIETRDGVGIDRHTGGASHGAKFDYQVVPAGSVFSTRIIIRNFELWQIGLLAFILRDLNKGFLRIGSGKARGLGGIKGTIKSWTFYQVSKDSPERYIRGIGILMGDERSKYMISHDEEILQLPNDFPAWTQDILRWNLDVPRNEAAINNLQKSFGELFIRCIDKNLLPKGIAAAKEASVHE